MCPDNNPVMRSGGSDAWRSQIAAELQANILSFWANKAVDHERGGFFGAIDADGRPVPDAPRSAVLNTRILWAFSAATRALGERYRTVADRAYRYVTGQFYDRETGGLYWMLDAEGRVLAPHKQIYAQAFGVYALSEYHRATGTPESLLLARQLFDCIEMHAADAVRGGYFEARAADWSTLADVRLSEKDLNCPKSMNTNLHVMEAYTNLLRVWPDGRLRERLSSLLHIVMSNVFDGRKGHLDLFFDEAWRPVSEQVSYGHDIETSWLLVEAAEVLGGADTMRQARECALVLARNVSRHGVDEDGGVFNEADAQHNLIDDTKHWWAQAEAVVGFYNAFKISGRAEYLQASQRSWAFIRDKVVDRVHGEWHAKLSATGTPLGAAEDSDVCLTGPWKCPYHNSRMCFEMLDRLGAGRSG